LIWLEQHLGELISIDELARAVGLSRRSLEYRFRNQIGCAPYQKLLQMRLRKARELILTTNRTINSIALETGFSNQREFCVRFKQKEGCTPTDFREQGVGRG
jgi:transcriptional regulator GlxA family with amidase domain